jgi:hypothetical protein
MMLAKSNVSLLTEKSIQMRNSLQAGKIHSVITIHAKHTTLRNDTHHKHLPLAACLTSYTQIKTSLCPCTWVLQIAIEVWNQADDQTSPTMPLLETQAACMLSLGQILSNWNHTFLGCYKLVSQRITTNSNMTPLYKEPLSHWPTKPLEQKFPL